LAWLPSKQRSDQTPNRPCCGQPAQAYLLYGMQALVAQQIQAFMQFPPRQKPAAFNLDAVLAQVQDAGNRQPTTAALALQCCI
jgi:hypothetical protein